MRKDILFYMMALSLVASSASAHRVADTSGPNCVNGMQESVNMNVSFNIRGESFMDAKKKFDEKMAQVNDFAKKQNIEKFDLQSMNYNINAQPDYVNNMTASSGYQLNGNANYILDSSDNAFKLGEFLTQQKFHVSINANKFKNVNCMNQSEPVVAPAVNDKPANVTK